MFIYSICEARQVKIDCDHTSHSNAEKQSTKTHRRCTGARHTMSCYSHRWSPPTAASKPPGLSTSPPGRWCWDLQRQTWRVWEEAKENNEKKKVRRKEKAGALLWLCLEPSVFATVCQNSVFIFRPHFLGTFCILEMAGQTIALQWCYD